MTSSSKRAVPMAFFIGLVAAATALDGCGGCIDDASAVTITPAERCLTVFAGQSATDPTVCGDPDLTIKNSCSDALVLPAATDGSASITIAAGASGTYQPPASAAKAGSNGNGTYTIDAQLGTTPIVIAFDVHRK